MMNTIKILLAGVLALALWNVGHAQDALRTQPSVIFAGGGPSLEEVPAPGPLAGSPLAAPGAGVSAAGSGEPQGILETLPQPPDLPASLFSPSPPPSLVSPDAGRPYFSRDGLLDSSVRPPGWFAGVDVAVLKPHLVTQNNVATYTQLLNGTWTAVNIPSAPLNWAISPRVFVGYRLPSGFGELSIAYRNLSSVGSTVAPVLNGPTSLTSRINLNIVDFDYSNSEPTPLPWFDMKWTAGLRFLTLTSDSQAQQPFAQAAAGNGILQEQISNNIWGLGPHAAVDMACHLRDPRWSLFARADAASVFTFVDTKFQSTMINPVGPPILTEIDNPGHQIAPMINVQAGLSWQPSLGSATRFYLGYQNDHIWDLNFLAPTGSNPPGNGEISAGGIVLKATFLY